MGDWCIWGVVVCVCGMVGACVCAYVCVVCVTGMSVVYGVRHCIGFAAVEHGVSE